MKSTAKFFLSLVATGLLAAPVVAQTQAPPCRPLVSHKHKKSEKVPVCAAEQQLSDLQAQLKAQQAQIDALSSQLKAQPAGAETDPIATPIANKAASDAADAETKAADASATANGLKTTVGGLQDGLVKAQKDISDLETPSAIHYKGVLIQPGGFAAAETVYRVRAVNSDIATPFSAIPYLNSTNAYLSEFNGTARQSRLSLLVAAPFSWGKAGAYFETDFLGAGTTSNNNQTNSYVLRIRSAFGQVMLNNGFAFQAGQMFTLETEVKKGILAGPGAEALPPTIDPNYIVGFNFGRQYALRAAQSFAHGKANVAVSAEESQIIFVGSNAPSNFVFGGAGSAGGLFNSTGGSANGGSAAGATAATQNYTDNLAPDLHAKITFDPGYGHFEIGGMARFFRDRTYAQSCNIVVAAGTFCPTANVTTSGIGNNYTTLGGGGYASLRLPVSKFADVGLKAYFGKGTERYAAANLGDVTVRPSGQLEPLKDAGGLFELDLHPTKKLDVFFLAGTEYLQRTTYVSPLTGLQVGYAGITGQNNTGCATQTAPTSANGYGYSVTANCAGAPRYMYEITSGITYRFFTSPTKGRFQFQATYSYLDKQSWQGYAGAVAPTATNKYPTGDTFRGAQSIEPMVHTSFRYYIP